MARQAILFGFGGPIYVNETGTRQAILPTGYLDETIAPDVTPTPAPVKNAQAGVVGGGRRRKRPDHEQPLGTGRRWETTAPVEPPKAVAPKRQARRIVAVPPDDEPVAPGIDAGPLLAAAEALIAERLAEQAALEAETVRLLEEAAAEEDAVAMILIAAGT